MADDKWVEIISVRLSGQENKARVKEMLDHIRSGSVHETETKIEAELYVNQKLDSDWSIHLVRSQKDRTVEKTVLGSCIAEAFSSLGLVNHTIWESVSNPKVNTK